MSLFKRRGDGGEHRSITGVPWNRDGASLNGGSLEAALRLIPVYSACTLIVDSISTLPVKAYRDSAGGKIAMSKQPQIVTDPGPYGLDRASWLGQAILSLLLRGNAYGAIVATDGAGNATQVKWLHPDAVRIDESKPGAPVYWHGNVDIDRSTLVHVRSTPMPGSIKGLSPIALFKAQIETGLRVGDLARKWYADGTAPQAVLFNKTRPLEQGEAAIAKARFKEAVAGNDVLVTGSDWGYLPLSVSPKDADFISQIKATATEIAAVYHVPPEEIGGTTGGSMTYSTLEMNMIKFGQRAILPWTTRIESALTRLLPQPQYVKFNLDALARTDLKTRMEAHQVALVNGIEFHDEVRALEDKPPATTEQIDSWQTYYGKRGNVVAPAPTTEDGE